MTSIVIVSGSDHNYFPLLREMIQSIKRFPQARDFKFAVMDTGLTEEDLVWLRANVDYIHAPDWPTAIPAYKIRGRNYLKSCVCRPWINTYFPGHDVYVWMDADTWVQDWEGFALFLEGADRGKLAIAGQVDRAYPRAVRIKWLGPLPLNCAGFTSRTPNRLLAETGQNFIRTTCCKPVCLRYAGTPRTGRAGRNLFCSPSNAAKSLPPNSSALGCCVTLKDFHLKAYLHGHSGCAKLCRPLMNPRAVLSSRFCPIKRSVSCISRALTRCAVTVRF